MDVEALEFLLSLLWSATLRLKDQALSGVGAISFVCLILWWVLPTRIAEKLDAGESLKRLLKQSRTWSAVAFIGVWYLYALALTVHDQDRAQQRQIDELSARLAVPQGPVPEVSIDDIQLSASGWFTIIATNHGDRAARDVNVRLSMIDYNSMTEPRGELPRGKSMVVRFPMMGGVAADRFESGERIVFHVDGCYRFGEYQFEMQPFKVECEDHRCIKEDTLLRLDSACEQLTEEQKDLIREREREEMESENYERASPPDS